MRDNDIWFKYRKNKFDIKSVTWEGFVILIIVLVLFVSVGFYVLDGEDSLKKVILGFLGIGVILTLLYILVEKKGKKVN